MLLALSCDSNDGVLWNICHSGSGGCQSGAHHIAATHNVLDGTLVTLHMGHHEGVHMQKAQGWDHIRVTIFNELELIVDEVH